MIQYVIPTKSDASKTVTSISKISSKTKIHMETDHLNIFQKYNRALNNMNIGDNDVIVFLHDDIDIRDEWFEQKIKMFFEYRKKVAIAGVIGTNEFNKEGGWWHTDRLTKTRGRIIQGFENDTRENVMSEQAGIDDTNIISIDGCILFIRGSVAKSYRFDEGTYDGYHFYDVDCCFTLLEQGWDIGIIDVLVKHASEGPLTESWYKNRDRFIQKWENKGYTFPITKEQFNKENK